MKLIGYLTYVHYAEQVANTKHVNEVEIAVPTTAGDSMLHFHVTGAHAIPDECEKPYWRRVLQSLKKNTTPLFYSELNSQLAALHSQTDAI
jgi:hypothetical protein